MDIETETPRILDIVKAMAGDEIIPHLIVVKPDGMDMNAMPEFGGWESSGLLKLALRDVPDGALCFLATETWVWPDETPGARIPNMNRMTAEERAAAGVREALSVKVWTHPRIKETRHWRANIGDGRAIEPWREVTSASPLSGLAPAN